jgi:ADP-heptose:LPS heptosyltransferase
MKVLVSRFSSIGDVALCVPILHALNQQHGNLEILMLSRPGFQSLFAPLNLDFIGADLKGKHNGLSGLRRLKDEIVEKYTPDKYVDLHDVLRTQILRTMFSWQGTPVSRIRKGRAEKKALTRRHNKVFKPLPHTLERYQTAFAEAGISVRMDLEKPALPEYTSPIADAAWEKLSLSEPAIGIAPTAAHRGKIWPIEKVSDLLDELADLKLNVLLFGGPDDRTLLESMTKGRNHVYLSPAGLSFGEEVAIMKNLQLMISMDSANMHLAALAQIPVLSIWGATHHYAGFSPIGQPAERIIGVPHDELTCRPCSVYGNKDCFRKDYACLNRISSNSVFEKVSDLLEQI